MPKWSEIDGIGRYHSEPLRPRWPAAAAATSLFVPFTSPHPMTTTTPIQATSDEASRFYSLDARCGLVWSSLQIAKRVPKRVNTTILAPGEGWNGERRTNHGESQPSVSNWQ
jgi:hypothetical protein